MKIRSLIILICIIQSIYGFAGIPKKAQDAFSYCFNNKETGIEDYININGIFNGYIFYPNGLFVMSSIHRSDKEQNFNNNYDYLLSLEKAMDGRTKEAMTDFYRWSYWGCYIIENNIIKVQMIDKPAYLSTFNGAFERWFKIIDKNTIGYLGQFRIDAKTYYDDFLNINSSIKFEIKLLQAKTIPSYNEAWILKEKWFWCNENEWKEFMKNRKK